MKIRHICVILIGTGLMIWSLISCELGAVSIDQRISTFQSDLNNSDRSNIYQDFHPTETHMYTTLKSSTATIDTPYPAPNGGTNYVLVIDSESNTSAVLVHMAAYPSGATLIYLQLQMDTYNGNDWRIVQLNNSSTPGSYTNLIN